MLARIETDLLSNEAMERFTSKIRRRMSRRPVDPVARRRKALESAVGNFTDASAKGLLSPALAKTRRQSSPRSPHR